MTGALRLYLDFASPYSYFALRPLARLAEEHGRALEIRPILLWAVFKQQGVVNPLEKPARRRYFLEDVTRSAEFFGLPFRVPEPLQISAHLAGRLYHGWTVTRPQEGLRLASEIFEAFFAKGEDITDPAERRLLGRQLAGAGGDSAILVGEDTLYVTARQHGVDVLGVTANGSLLRRCRSARKPLRPPRPRRRCEARNCAHCWR